MVSIAAALQRIKEDPRGIDPNVAEGVCIELGLEWRNTPLTPAATISLLARQVLAGNISNQELIRLANLRLTPEAYCTAKGRLPIETLSLINRRVCDAAQQRSQPLWKGHRTWHADGSSFSMPDTPELKTHFGQPGQQKIGCGFPVAHLLCLFQAESGMLADAVASPLRTHDLSQMPRVHEQLCANDVLIADTAFGSYFHLAALQKRGVFGIFPVHQARIVSFRPGRRHLPPGAKRYARSPQDRRSIPTSRWVKKLGKDDQLVEYFKPANCPTWMTPPQHEAAPELILVREIRRTVYRSGFRPMTIVVVTTLLDPVMYPADQIVLLLKGRWNVETNLRHLKTTMKMEVLRVLMMEGAARQKVPLDRISFADALYWMRHADVAQQIPELIINPLRTNRIEPRAIKRRPKEYDRLNKPRAEMRKALKNQR